MRWNIYHLYAGNNYPNLATVHSHECNQTAQPQETLHLSFSLAQVWANQTVPQMLTFPLQSPMSTQYLRPLRLQNPFPRKLRASLNATTSYSSLKQCSSQNGTMAILTLDELPPNALRRKRDPQWRGGFSLGLDLGMARTGLALSKGFSIRPLTVLELRGQKLELQLLKIAEQEEADEYIVGLPKSSDGKETAQSNKVRSIAGRLAVRAAERGWRVYLQDEHGTTTEAIDRMINMGLSKSSQQRKLDAYAAMMVLERYFYMSGEGVELVLPKNLDLQEKLQRGPPEDIDFADEFED